MPVVNIEYDSKKVKKLEIVALSKAVHKIVSEATKIEDVPVYANNSQIKFKVSPIEIFVRISAHKVNNLEDLTKKIESKLSEWKKKNSFPQPINLSVILMQWKIKIGI